MGTPEPSKKEPLRIGTFIGPIIFFGLAAACFYLAYVGMASGTSYRTAKPPGRHRGEYIYGGVDTREENPKQFWSIEGLFICGGVMFGTFGVHWLRGERRGRQHTIKSQE